MDPQGKPRKHSAAAVIRRGEDILTLIRPADEPELPGVRGLPAGSYRAGETLGELVRRIGRDKLGVELEAGRLLVSGTQERPAYILDMDLVEARMAGIPAQGEWKWDRFEALEPGMRLGSLCCELGLGLRNRK